MRYLVDSDDDNFAQSCAAANPIICRGSSTAGNYALNIDGDLPVNCTRADTAPSCTITKLANSVCDVTIGAFPATLAACSNGQDLGQRRCKTADDGEVNSRPTGAIPGQGNPVAALEMPGGAGGGVNS